VLAPSLINAHVHARPQARASISLDAAARADVPDREPTPSRLPHPARSLSAAGLPGFPLSHHHHHARAAHSALQRSNSALSLPNITLPPISTLTDSLPSSAVPSATPSPAFVPPSRLSHRWDSSSCADEQPSPVPTPTGTPMTAEPEGASPFGVSPSGAPASGSAALAAISLMRSSGVHAGHAKRHILPNKQPWSTVAQPVLDTTSFEQRLQISRFSPAAPSRPHSISSLLSPDESMSEKPRDSPARVDVSMLLAPASKEGNKENRRPEDRFSCQPVQPQPHRPRVLPRMLHGDDAAAAVPVSPAAPANRRLGKRRPSDGSRLGAYGDGSDAHNDGRRVRRRSDDDDDDIEEEEQQQQQLAHGAKKSTDLDCITGLLRLRDGNWR
jgi:hypothetical protein